MATDIFALGNYGADPSSPPGISPTSASFDTGDLRRRYNFGDRVSELAISQDPFFRFVSKVAKKATDDPQFKYTERRPSFHKRYAYCVATSADNVTYAVDGTIAANGAGTYYMKMKTDYLNTGNISSVFGQASTAIDIGATDTQPLFFLPNQLVKVNLNATSALSSNQPTDYAIFKIDVVTMGSSEEVLLAGTWVKTSAVTNLCFDIDTENEVEGFTQVQLENARCRVVGTAHGQGTGFPQSWKDQPFSTGYGNTQIWKTALAMDNTTRATVLKYEANEWARIWREKLIEHKWDIEQSLLFSSQDSTGSTWYTQGIVDYISSYGNSFSLPIATKTQDDFLEDMSAFLDPRYNGANATLFFVGTDVYNWLHKLTGYFQNNLHTSPNFTSEMAMTGKKKVFGVDITTITTPYGDMNVARNVHLDGTNVGILAVNMKYVNYRPLVGNGVNRDTAVYVGVQTLENSGVDRRVDLIQTEAGMEVQMPEAHAMWVKS